MIRGIGCDLIEIARIEKSIFEHGAHFLDRIFTPKEQEYCQRYKAPHSHYAARFAAKEAIAKALGTGLGKSLSWTDLEILPDDLGKPHCYLSKKAASTFQNPIIQISLSHTQTHAMAVAISS